MMRVTMIALAGAGGLLFSGSDADAQDYRYSRHRQVRTCGSPRSGFNVHLGFSRGYSSYARAPRMFDSRHCGRCQPVRQRCFVNQPRYQRVFVGYDSCGRPVYRRICVQRGYWTTRTRYRCF